MIEVLEDNGRIVLGAIAEKVYLSEIKFLKEVLKTFPYEDMEAICAIGSHFRVKLEDIAMNSAWVDKSFSITCTKKMGY